jgi:maleamate amidohydrolase
VAIDIYERQGFGGRLELVGRVALLVVDFTNGFADPAVFGGGNIASAIDRTSDVLARCREMGLPIAFSRIVFAADGSDRNVFSTKLRGLDRITEESPLSAIVPALAPAAGELVVSKTVPSAFFGTALASWLVERGVRSLFVAGATTSGCIRASVVDAMSYGFRPFVLADCVGDRAAAPHDANLFDMAQKYAEVLSSTEAFDRLARLASHHASAIATEKSTPSQ